MGTMVRLALATILLAATSRATDFTDYSWTTTCASVQAAQLVMDTCSGGSSCASSHASFIAPLPGTFTLDMHYEIEQAQWLTGLVISVDSGQTAFTFGSAFGGPWCPNAPCSGDVTGIVIPVQAGNQVLFALDATEQGCVGNNGTRCTFSNLQFFPEVGIHPVGGGVAAGQLFDIEVPVTANGNQVYGLVGMGDLDGDGHDDWAYGVPYAGTLNVKLRMVSGADGSALHDIKGLSYENLGQSIANLGDVDGDGVNDLAAAEPTWPHWYDAVGRVHVFSGATKATLFTLVGTVEDQPLSGVGAPGDVDGDGLGDLLVGVTAATGPAGIWSGEVKVLSGATQAVLFDTHGDNSKDYLGSSLTGLGDVDADGTPDFAAVAYGYPAFQQSGLVRVWSGATGAVLHSFVGAWGAEPLERTGRVGDVNGDGHADIFTGAPHSRHGALNNIGLARVRSGATGAVLFTKQGTVIEEYVGWDGTAAGDLDGDGLPDVLVASPGWNDHGRVQVLAGPAGQPLFEVAPDTELVFVGGHIAGGSDVDADGQPDLLVSAQTTGFDGHVLGYSGLASASAPPLLAAAGSLLPGTQLSISLDGGPPGGAAVLVVGLSADPLPFKGGVLVPAPDLLLPMLLAPDGSLDLAATWPAALTAPLAVVVQVWCVEPAAATGFVGSDALLLAPP